MSLQYLLVDSTVHTCVTIVSPCGSTSILGPLQYQLVAVSAPWCHYSIYWWLHWNLSATTVSLSGSTGTIVTLQCLLISPLPSPPVPSPPLPFLLSLCLCPHALRLSLCPSLPPISLSSLALPLPLLSPVAVSLSLSLSPSLPPSLHLSLSLRIVNLEP